MKKMLSCLLVVALFLSLGLFGGWSGLASAGVPLDRAGTYEMVEISIDGEDYTDFMKEAGILFTLELYEDGTALLDGGTEGTMSFHWDDTYFIYDSGEKSPYEYKDGVLTLKEDGTVMVFKRGGAAVEAPAETEEEPGDITGAWVGTVDMREIVVGEAGDLDAYLKSAPVYATMNMKADGSYALSIDGNPALDAMKDALRDYIEDLRIENNLTQAQLEAALGGSVDAYIDSAMSGVDLSGLVTGGAGKYIEEDGAVTWDPGAKELSGLFTGDFLTFTVEDVGDVALTREKLQGLWVGKVDMREKLLEEVPDMEGYLDEAPMYLYLELKEDGGFELTADGTSLLPVFRDAAYRYFEATCQENNISMEDLEQSLGMDVDSYLDGLIATFDVEDLSEKLEGSYGEENGKLTLYAGSGNSEGSYDGFMIRMDSGDYGKISFTRATFLGTWAGYADVTELLTEGDEELGQYVKDVKGGVTVELKADGSYTVTMNGRPMMASLRSGFRAYVEHQIEANGMTVEQLEASLGMSLDEYIDSALEEIDTEDLLASEEGSFTVENGRIVFDGSSSGLMGGVWSGTTLIFTIEDVGDVILNRR